MSERTFRRIKEDLPPSNKQRFKVISDDTITFYHESLDELRIAKNELVNIIKNPNTSAAFKIRASTALFLNLTTMAEFYDSSQVISGISKLKGKNENTI